MLVTMHSKIHSYLRSIMHSYIFQKFENESREILLTCGNQSDPRIQLGVKIADELTFIFRSDSNDQQNKGVNLTILEINATAANVSKDT